VTPRPLLGRLPGGWMGSLLGGLLGGWMGSLLGSLLGGRMGRRMSSLPGGWMGSLLGVVMVVTVSVTNAANAVKKRPPQPTPHTEFPSHPTPDACHTAPLPSPPLHCWRQHTRHVSLAQLKHLLLLVLGIQGGDTLEAGPVPRVWASPSRLGQSLEAGPVPRGHPLVLTTTS